MVPCRFQTLPLPFFNWGLIKILETNWVRVLTEPLCITHTSGISCVGWSVWQTQSVEGQQWRFLKSVILLWSSSSLLICTRRGKWLLMFGMCHALASSHNHVVWLPVYYRFDPHCTLKREMSPPPWGQEETRAEGGRQLVQITSVAKNSPRIVVLFGTIVSFFRGGTF